MYLQGDLQTVFDALYHLGVIDPVLDKDWSTAIDEMKSAGNEFTQVLAVANSYQADLKTLMDELGQFDDETLAYLAMEVAREFADFQTRDLLH